MGALIRAIERAMEFLHQWVSSGFSWAHTEWFSKVLDFLVSYGKKLTWFYALAVTILAFITGQSAYVAGMLAAMGSDLSDMALNAGAAFNVADKTLVVTTAWGFFDYLFPVKELLIYLAFFIAGKVSVSVARMTVAVWQLLPFKAT